MNQQHQLQQQRLRFTQLLQSFQQVLDQTSSHDLSNPFIQAISRNTQEIQRQIANVDSLITYTESLLDTLVQQYTFDTH